MILNFLCTVNGPLVTKVSGSTDSTCIWDETESVESNESHRSPVGKMRVLLRHDDCRFKSNVIRPLIRKNIRTKKNHRYVKTSRNNSVGPFRLSFTVQTT